MSNPQPEPTPEPTPELNALTVLMHIMAHTHSADCPLDADQKTDLMAKALSYFRSTVQRELIRFFLETKKETGAPLNEIVAQIGHMICDDVARYRAQLCNLSEMVKKP